MDDVNERGSKIILDILLSAGLTQHVKEPTHVSGHTLDLLITRDSANLVFNISVVKDLPSDHYGVMCDVSISRPPTSKHVIKSRPLRSISATAFHNDIVKILYSDKPRNVNRMVE